MDKEKVVSLDSYKRKQLDKMQEKRIDRSKEPETFEQLLEKAIRKEFGPILSDSIYKSIIGAYEFSEKAHNILYERDGDDALKIRSLKMCFDDYSDDDKEFSNDEKWED
ncbi:hypothetical protein [Heliorestis convoluta]|uniref:Uncharacterized protein n=1 Tax=Heliorestis convoluta TaxID=356322 RepID=A0A5Q2N1H4_9FIRM|nr:hypothetical protein [Heliorestis convoluta]QGG47142.1 hypothetical protein FTV88_0990 [Heliorestis convoluta]